MGIEKRRYKNYGLWVAIAALIYMFINDLGFGLTPDKWDLYVNSILSILVLLGIITDPSIGGSFNLDKKDSENGK